MKKFISILLCLAMLFCCCACGEKNTVETNSAADEGLNLSVIQQFKTQEELAAYIGVENTGDIRQVFAYLNNYYSVLPSEKDDTAKATSWSTTDEGYNSLTLAQAKTLITPTVVTTENWKDFYEAATSAVPYFEFDDEGNEIITYEDDTRVSIKAGYHTSNNFSLVLVNKNTGEEFEADTSWPYYVELIDGKYNIVIENYNEETGEWDTSYEEYDPDNYICSYADGVVYSYDIDPQLIYKDSWNEETFDYEYTLAYDSETEYDESDYESQFNSVFIQFGEDGSSENVCIVGYEGLGDYVYNNDEAATYKTNDDSVIEIKPAEKLDLDALKKLGTREELASALGISKPSELRQMLTYLENYYYHLPSENDSTEAASGWSTTDEGYNSLTIKQAKALVTPTVVTTENWKNFIATYTETIKCYSYDENGNETITDEEQAEIGIAGDKYNYSWDKSRLILINNETGELVDYNGFDGWPEPVQYKDGKYIISVFDDIGFCHDVEFNIDNYSCIYADCIVYEYELDPQLLYVEYYDEACDEWIVVQADEYTGEEETPLVFVQSGETNSDINRVGESSLGDYVYMQDGYM